MGEKAKGEEQPRKCGVPAKTNGRKRKVWGERAKTCQSKRRMDEEVLSGLHKTYKGGRKIVTDRDSAEKKKK